MSFNYTALRSDQLRLLRPLVIRDNLLSFQMLPFPRASTPAYTALSYTWGDGAPTERIFINGQPFPVRLNLWSCLYYLNQDEIAAWTHLWVDALCIDQTNDQERNAQVRAMDMIYRNALSVSVWLGLPPSEEQFGHWHEPIKTFEDSSFEWFDNVQNLSNRPYWTRVWVVQEFLLGRDVELYCGSTRMNWLDFKDLLGHEIEGGGYLMTDFDYTKHRSGSWAAWPLVTGRHVDRYPDIQRPLHELLINHCNSQCKDARDRVFALLGLVPPDERGLLERFFPDYTMSEDDVIIIALSHVRQINSEYDGRDAERLFSGLGVTDGGRRKRLWKRARQYDYLSEIPPEFYEWMDENGTDGGWMGEDGWRQNDERGSILPKWSTCAVSATLLLVLLGTGLVLYRRGQPL